MTERMPSRTRSSTGRNWSDSSDFASSREICGDAGMRWVSAHSRRHARDALARCLVYIGLQAARAVAGGTTGLGDVLGYVTLT